MSPDEYLAAVRTFVLQQEATQKRFEILEQHLTPILNEDTPTTEFDHHYVYHQAWAARALRRIQPSLHHDFSSAIDFSVIASAWTPLVFCDYRPAELHLPGLGTKREDLMQLSFSTGSLESVSCMHVIEHIGLGRYGDTLDYDGDLKAIVELKRVVRPGGNLLVVLPLAASPRIHFNAHRIYSWNSVLDLFQDQCYLVESALIPDQTSLGMVYSPDDVLLNLQQYACGCFWFKKFS
jgi:hypothetical protein